MCVVFGVLKLVSLCVVLVVGFIIDVVLDEGFGWCFVED